MPRYKICWNVGYGDNVEFEDFDTQGEADGYAYEKAREDFEAWSSHYATEMMEGEEEEE